MILKGFANAELFLFCTCWDNNFGKVFTIFKKYAIIIVSHKLNNRLKGYFLYTGDIVPFFRHTKILFGKSTGSTNFGMAEIFLIRLVCVTTIGVCVFRCADFGWRTF